MHENGKVLIMYKLGTVTDSIFTQPIKDGSIHIDTFIFVYSNTEIQTFAVIPQTKSSQVGYFIYFKLQ